MKHISQTRMGALYRVRVLSADGQVKDSSDWQSNMILDVAASYMQKGFSSAPVPKLGSSISAVAASQTGVQAPLTQMVLSSSSSLWAGTYTRVSDTEAYVSWGDQYVYTNNGTSAASISEAGIDNFNRILFTDAQGNAKVWSISPNESLILDMDFRIDALGSSTTTNMNVLDPAGNVLNTVNASVKALDQFLTGTPTWWKLLSTVASNLSIVFDSGFTGTKPVTDSTKIAALTDVSFSYTGRTLNININFVGATGGSSVKGFMIGFNSLSPSYSIVYDTPIHVGSGYTFSTGLSINW